MKESSLEREKRAARARAERIYAHAMREKPRGFFPVELDGEIVWTASILISKAEQAAAARGVYVPEVGVEFDSLTYVPGEVIYAWNGLDIGE